VLLQKRRDALRNVLDSVHNYSLRQQGVPLPHLLFLL
jgi:hypothetical protein